MNRDLEWWEIFSRMRELNILSDVDIKISKETVVKILKPYLSDPNPDKVNPFKELYGDVKKDTTRRQRRELDRKRKAKGNNISVNINLSKFGNVW